jgi:5-oxoprolinase (ATP-hydrolysing)
MVVFGGAGGQYAGAVARRLGLRDLYFHPLAGVLSAYGIGAAPFALHRQADLGRRPVTSDEPLAEALAGIFEALEREAHEALSAEGGDVARLIFRRQVDLRYEGTATAITVDLGAGHAGEDARARFEAAHRLGFGYVRDGHPIEATTARLEASIPTDVGVVKDLPPSAHEAPVKASAELVIDGVRRAVPVHRRRALGVGETLRGPALILDDTGTIVVEPGCVVTRREDGILHMRDEAGLTSQAPDEDLARPDPVRLEVMSNLFMSIAEQMGHVLRRTALSTNIRERLDFSCAVFDADGGLVANAPHIPVHLGAMSETVRAVRRAHPEPAPGDVFATNDPAEGGSHLPDLTLVSPVHGPDGALRFYVASRGHHADIGGITPGSMPPFSTTIEEEGVVFRHMPIVRGGVFDEAGFRAKLAGAKYPARRPDENVGDVEAHLAANRLGARLLGELSARYGHPFVRAYMGHVQANAGAAVREAIAKLPDGERRFEDALDDGSPIEVRLVVQGDRMRIDFTGTAEPSSGNANAPRAVTLAAVLYVLRILAAKPIPLNGGCLDPVELIVPKGSLLDPPPGHAVAAGNVETSQRVVDVLLGALGLAAASQGTMNNFTFGDASFGYYETIGGGAGALPDADGASGVHTHMTNSRITDPEILETRFPVRVRRFAIRRGSGGRGRQRGGDGLVRELELLAPLDVAILAERRSTRPFGLAGGEPGAPGRNLLNGRELPGRVAVHTEAGAVLRIETPGGGGYGAPETGAE